MIGICISHYRILEKLGAGGMGEVFAAEDMHLARRVAIKFPSLGRQARDGPGRFLAEARAASRLDHANIARVYDYGEAPDGRPFLVMELIKGTTLRQILKGGPLPSSRSIAIVESVLRALGEAHRHGLIHRDIKPSNVMLNETGEVKVLDFGLAKEIVAPATGSPTEIPTAPMGFTAPGALGGTPQYMSPEQVHGSVLDQRSDLFSAGLVLYECLTGQAAFSGATTREILENVTQSNPLRPSSQVPAVPAALDRITGRALAKAPADRYQTAEQMLADLAAASGGRTTWNSVALAIFAGRWKWVGPALVTLLLVAAFLFWRSRPHRPPMEAMEWYQRGAVALRDGTYYRAAKALERAVAVDPDFALAYARLAEARNELDDAAGASSAMLRALPRQGAHRPLALDALRIDAIHRTLMRDFAGAIRAYSELAAGLPDAEKTAVFVDLGRVREMNQEVSKALEAYREASSLDRQNAAAHLHAAMLLGRQRQPGEAAEFATAESLYQAMSNTEGQAEVLYQRGYLASRPGTLGEARAKLEKAGELARAISSEQQEIASSLQLAIVTYLEGDPVKAEQTAAAAVERARRAGMMYLAARGLTTLGATQAGRRDYGRAEANIGEALEISRRSQMRRAEARALFSLANLHQTKGDAELALQEIAPALAYFQDFGFRVETIQCLTVKVRADRDLGNETSALEGFRKIRSLAETWGDRGQTAIAEQGIALVLFQREDWPQALEHFERYCEISKSIEDRDGIGRGLLGQANVLWRLGRFSDAEQRIGEAEALPRPPGGSSLLLLIGERRAAMALSRGRYSEAAGLARDLYEAKSSPPTDAELARCLAGLALARSGSARTGKTLCAKGVAAVAAMRNRFLLADTQLALAEILIANGEPSAAIEQVRHSIEVIDSAGRPESSWRAWLIAARAYRRAGDAVSSKAAVETARKRYDDLRGAWPGVFFDSYSKRPDIQSLLMDFKR